MLPSPPPGKEPQGRALKSILVTRGHNVKTADLEDLGDEAVVLAPWISPESMWKPDPWMRGFFLARKHEVSSGMTPSVFFVPIPLAIFASLKSSLEEVASNKYCQDQTNVNLSITLMPTMAEAPYSSDEEELDHL